MYGHLLLLSFSFIIMLSANAVSLSISKLSLNEMTAHATHEYQIHGCGRAIAAIKNFEQFSSLAISQGELSREHSVETLQLIVESLSRRYQNKFIVTQDQCIDKATGRAVVKLFLRNGNQNNKQSPNYFYRFL